MADPVRCGASDGLGARMMRLTRAIEFSTSLRCARPDLSDAENERLYGPDSRQHGHNYRLEVTLRGDPDPRTGMVIDLKEVQEILEREIMERFDHRDLNRDTPYFEKDAPTHENFARVIERILVAALPAGWLDRIRLQPEVDTWVEIVAPGSSDSARLRLAARSAREGDAAADGGGA